MNPIQKINRAFTFILSIGTLLLLLSVGQFVLWGVDRKAPLRMLTYTATPTQAGGNTLIHLDVKRDLTRTCAATYSRLFYDAAGSRYEITQGLQAMNATSIADTDRRTPDVALLSIRIPADAAPGKGSLVTALEYSCNPMHLLYPLPVLLTIDVEVLP